MPLGNLLGAYFLLRHPASPNLDAALFFWPPARLAEVYTTTQQGRRSGLYDSTRSTTRKKSAEQIQSQIPVTASGLLVASNRVHTIRRIAAADTITTGPLLSPPSHARTPSQTTHDLGLVLRVYVCSVPYPRALGACTCEPMRVRMRVRPVRPSLLLCTNQAHLLVAIAPATKRLRLLLRRPRVTAPRPHTLPTDKSSHGGPQCANTVRVPQGTPHTRLLASPLESLAWSR